MTEAALPRPSSSQAWIVLGLVAATLLVYAPVRHFAFVTWDDPLYITMNPDVLHGLSASSITWAFTTTHAPYWHPLTWLSHLLDVTLFGLDAGGHHLTSLVLHVANTLLLFAVLARTTRSYWRAAFVAALFALHPLHVESVAWVAERKDILSGFFWMLSILAYVYYAARRTLLRYSLVVLLFAAGLMAKPMVVTLPVILLLFDIWPLERVSLETTAGWVPLIAEKLPLFALALASGAATIIVQRHVGAVPGLRAFPWPLRVENAAVSYVAYVGQALWPVKLAAFYPYPTSISIAAAAGAALLTAALTALAITQARSRPYVTVGWCWFVIMLLPVIGIIQAGGQARADRFMYLPLVGLLIVAAWGAPALAARWKIPSRALFAAGLVIICACALASRQQLSFWQNSEALWSRVIAVTSDSYRAHDNLGNALEDRGDLDGAVREYTIATTLQPEQGDAHNNLGLVLEKQGRLAEALVQYAEAVRVSPALAEAHNNYGNLLAQSGRLPEAVAQFTESVRLDPALARPQNNLGNALAALGRTDDATEHYREAIRLDPNFAEAHNDLGAALAARGQFADASFEYRAALAHDPRQPGVHYNLAIALANLHQTGEAISELGEALALNPRSARYHYALALLLADHQRVAEAIQHLQQALTLDPQFAPARAELDALSKNAPSKIR